MSAGGWHDHYGWDVVPEALGQVLEVARGDDHATWLTAQGAQRDEQSLTWLLDAPTGSLPETGQLLTAIVSRGMRWRVWPGPKEGSSGS